MSDPYTFDGEEEEAGGAAPKAASSSYSKSKTTGRARGGLSLRKKTTEKEGEEGKTNDEKAGAGKDEAKTRKAGGGKDKKEQKKATPKAPTSWKEVKAFLAVKDEDTAKALTASIEGLGGKVQTRFTGPTTHLVFEGGKKAHFDKAAESGIPAVTPEWVTRCEKEKKLLATNKFVAELKGGKGGAKAAGAASKTKTANKSNTTAAPKKEEQEEQEEKQQEKDKKDNEGLGDDDEVTTDDDAGKKSEGDSILDISLNTLLNDDPVESGDEGADKQENTAKPGDKRKNEQTNEEKTQKKTKTADKEKAESNGKGKRKRTDGKDEDTKKTKSATKKLAEKGGNEAKKGTKTGDKKGAKPPSAKKQKTAASKTTQADEEGDEKTTARKGKGKANSKSKKDDNVPSRVILSSTLSAEQKATLDDIAAHLKDAEIVWEASVTNDATHLVCGSQKRTEKVLQALAKGIWILKWNWIIESMEEGKWLPEERYEANDWFPGAKSGRLSRDQTKGGLLHKKKIMIRGGVRVPLHSLERAIELADGKTVESYADVDYCIVAKDAGYEPWMGKLPKENCVVVQEDWLLDSLREYKLLPAEDYSVPTEPSGEEESVATKPRATRKPRTPKQESKETGRKNAGKKKTKSKKKADEDDGEAEDEREQTSEKKTKQEDKRKVSNEQDGSQQMDLEEEEDTAKKDGEGSETGQEVELKD